jgi:pyruvate/2-oxoglutarate/acetoin dehydrogenase E1 component
LHSWFAHVPGLRVVMPTTVADARDLLIASVLCKDPVIYIDDRWLYEQTDELGPIVELDLEKEGPKSIAEGFDVTIVASSYSCFLAIQARDFLLKEGLSAEIIDLRVLNPFKPDLIIESVKRTGRLLVVDGGWKTCGISAEVIASVVERINPSLLRKAPLRITLPDAPAPTSSALEKIYYRSADDVIKAVKALCF